MARSHAITDRDSKASGARRPKTVVARDRPVASALRKSGIRSIGDVTWGTHICAFYVTKEDLLDATIAYFKAGLQSNEFSLWAIADPIAESEAKDALRLAVPKFDRHLSTGRFELVNSREWYLDGDRFDLKRIIAAWDEKLRGALARGYDGIRVSGNAFWVGTEHWTAFCEYEQEINRWVTGRRAIVLCTYPLLPSRAVDILDVARTHQCTAARRNGDWEFLATPELRQAQREIKNLKAAFDLLLGPSLRYESLTSHERIALAQIVKGATSKEAARKLGVSPRTFEFHRANVMRKLGAKNTVDLVRKVLGE